MANDAERELNDEDPEQNERLPPSKQRQSPPPLLCEAQPQHFAQPVHFCTFFTTRQVYPVRTLSQVCFNKELDYGRGRGRVRMVEWLLIAQDVVQS